MTALLISFFLQPRDNASLNVHISLDWLYCIHSRVLSRIVSNSKHIFTPLSWRTIHKDKNITGYIVSQLLSSDFVNFVETIPFYFRSRTYIAQVIIGFRKFSDLTSRDFWLSHSTSIFSLPCPVRIYVFEEVCGSTFEEEQFLINIDSGAIRIIIKRTWSIN